MTAITVNPSNPDYSSVNGVLFNKNQTTLIEFPDAIGGSYLIPNSVTNIAAFAFWVCPYLTSVTIPNGLTSIGEEAFIYCTGLTSFKIHSRVTNIGDGAFADCSSLTSVTFEGNAPIADCNVFAGDNNLTVVYYFAGTTGWGLTFPCIPTVEMPYAVLTVSTNGVGSLSPNDNMASLQVGNDYSITATAGTGFVFTNWTGGTNLPLTVLTNGPMVQFVIEPNLMLQANFVDLTKPALSITNVPAGLSVSNATFTVKGNASDNWQVANVFYSLNSGGWNNAGSTNNWKNWTAPVMLIPGTNTIAAYAVDPGGDASLTTNASLFFVMTNQLQIRTIGLGTISPNYSNAWLNIGQNYSIISAPASGFVFTNWLVSTNWIGGVVMTGTNLQFMMESNLTLQATFVETSNPTLLITAPASVQHTTNALATVTGTTSDKWGVTGVWYQLNNRAWDASETTNGWTNWTTTVELISGTNTVKAYAMNLGGNASTNSSVSMVSSNTFMLQLVFTNAVPLKTNGLVFGLQLSTGLNGHIQVSTNLSSWITLTNFVGTNSTLIFRDPAAANTSRRFYRAVIP